MLETEQEITNLKQIFGKELTPELADVYVDSLVEHLGGLDQPLQELVEKGSAVHEEIGEKLYGPLIVGCINWIENQCGQANHTGPVFFALRDAAPLETAAKVLWNGKSIYPIGIYANRPMLGIEDEIAPEKAHTNGNVVEYLAMLGLADMKKVAWVDTGAWGTVVKALKLGLLNQADFMPLFWYSHNPHIPGYLNGLLDKYGVEEHFGEILNDSLECVFPQPFARPLDVIPGTSGWQVKLNLSSYLSMQWGYAALAGVQKAAFKSFLDGKLNPDKEITALTHLQALSQQANETGKWTGVLPTNTPTWSKGNEFLASFHKDLFNYNYE